MLYLFLRRFVVGPLVKLLFRPKVTGLENIPSEGPALLVSNHLAFCDSIFLPVAVPRQIVFPAKSEYFTAPGLRGSWSRPSSGRWARSRSTGPAGGPRWPR